MSKEEETVLITGAGPTGLVMANLLSRMDIPFFLIDKEQGPSRGSKAFGIHARSLEIFDQIEWIRKKNFRRLSQLAINYRYSSLNKKGSTNSFYRKAPRPGDRAPYCKMILNGKESDIFQLFKCTHFTLLIAFSDSENQKAANNIYEHYDKVSMLPMNVHFFTPETGGSFFDIYRVKKNAIFIVRPDGYIGLRSSGLDYREIKDYLNGF